MDYPQETIFDSLRMKSITSQGITLRIFRIKKTGCLNDTLFLVALYLTVNIHIRSDSALAIAANSSSGALCTR